MPLFQLNQTVYREVFLHPEVTDNYKIEWKEPNVEGVIDFMCRQKEFSEDRVRKSLDKMMEGSKKQKGKILWKNGLDKRFIFDFGFLELY